MTSENKTDVSPDNAPEEETLIEFPCEFAIKVMGPSIPEFHTAIETIAATHDDKFDMIKTTQNTSKTGKYVSLTITINAIDKPQLDAIYEDLTANEMVLWAL